MKKGLVIKQILAIVSVIGMVLSPMSAMQVQAEEGTLHKAYSKLIDSTMNDSEKMYFVEDGGAIQSFCLNGNSVFPPFLPADETSYTGYNPTAGMYILNEYQYTKKEIGAINTPEQAQKLNSLVGAGNPSKKGEDLRRWLLAVIEYYHGEYVNDAATYGIKKDSLMYIMAVQHGIWKVTDYSRKYGGGVEEEYATLGYFTRIITDQQTPDIKQAVADWLADETTISQLMDKKTPEDPAVLLARQVVGAVKLAEKIQALASPNISEYDLNHTLLVVYAAPALKAKGFSLQNLLSVSKTTDPKKPLTISKRIIDLAGNKTTSRVAGATLELYDLTGSSNIPPKVATIQTIEGSDEGSDWSADVYPGTYKLVETSVPSTFQKSPDIEFTIDANGVVTVTSPAGLEPDNNTVVMYDKKEYAEVKISKIDIASGDELPGATIRILEKDGTTVAKDNDSKDLQWVSEAAVKTFQIKPGDYFLEEVTAPKGYEVAELIAFTVNPDGSVNSKAVENGILVMKDAPESVLFSKQDINVTAELPGAHIRIVEGEGTTGNEVASWTSGNTAHKIYQTMFTPNTPYTMVETQAPEGYLVAESISFMINENAEVLVKTGNGYQKQNGKLVVMKDDKKPEIHKQVNRKEPAETLGKIDQVFTYTIETSIPKAADLVSFVVTDDLDPVLAYKTAKEAVSVKIGNGVDLTGSGAVEINGQKMTVTVPEQYLAKEYRGQALVIEFDAIIRVTDAELVKVYANRTVPNTATYLINNTISEKSNTVTVTPTPPKDPPTTPPVDPPTPPTPPTPPPYIPPYTPPTTTTYTPPTTVTVTPNNQEVLGATRTPAATPAVEGAAVLGSRRATSPNTADTAPILFLLFVMASAAICGVALYVRWTMQFRNSRTRRRAARARSRRHA